MKIQQVKSHFRPGVEQVASLGQVLIASLQTKADERMVQLDTASHEHDGDRDRSRFD